jgi:hypothetical protein
MKKHVLHSRPEWVLSALVIVARQIVDLSVNSLRGKQKGNISVDANPPPPLAEGRSRSREIVSNPILLKQSQSRSYRVTCPPNAEVAPNMEERQVLLIFFTYLTCTNR